MTTTDKKSPPWHRTAYTCPILMIVSGWLARLRGKEIVWHIDWGRRSEVSFWRVSEARDGKPWMPLSCAFPKWMIYSELWCRNKYRYLQYRVGLLTGRYKKP